MTGVEMITVERERQMSVEGWTAEHDAEHDEGDLAMAAACYVVESYEPGGLRRDWPWAPWWWKPSADPVRNLVKAGALIAAEIDRLTSESRTITT